MHDMNLAAEAEFKADGDGNAGADVCAERVFHDGHALVAVGFMGIAERVMILRERD